MRKRKSVTPAIIASVIALVLISGVVMSLGNAKDISQEALQERMKSPYDTLILDVRTEREYNNGHVPGAINIPHKELHDRLDELKPHKGKSIVLYCESGRRAGIATELLEQAGFSKLLHLKGDMKAWRNARLPQE